MGTTSSASALSRDWFRYLSWHWGEGWWMTRVRWQHRHTQQGDRPRPQPPTPHPTRIHPGFTKTTKQLQNYTLTCRKTHRPSKKNMQYGSNLGKHRHEHECRGHMVEREGEHTTKLSPSPLQHKNCHSGRCTTTACCAWSGVRGVWCVCA